jgi:hypothetical protein
MQNPQNPDLPTNPPPGETPTEIPEKPQRIPNPKDNPVAMEKPLGFVDKFLNIGKNEYKFK